MRVRADARTLGFARHPAVARLSQQGPATPDHVIRTKRVPMLGDDVDAYVAAYREYLKALDLWKDRRRRDELAARTKMFATWFGGVLLAELMLGGIGVLKVASSRGKPVRR